MPTLSLNRKAVRTALTTIALAFAGSAQAALIEVDWQTGGDNALVRDTGTNLEWLDVANTGGLSYDFVSANLGVGGQFEGFRYATPAELATFFTNAGIPDLDSGLTAANVPSVLALIQIWDADIWGIADSNGQFGYMLTTELVSPGVHGAGLLWVPQGNANAEAATFNRNSLSDDSSLFYIGSALVRDAVPSEVPEPSGMALVAMGLGGLVIRRLHKKLHRVS